MDDHDARIKRCARSGALAAMQAVSMLLGAEAWAQSSACEQLKSTLSARFDASGVRGYVLEAVPADAPVPPDARVIGNCDAGRTRMLYRKGAGKPAVPAPTVEGAAAGRAAPAVPAAPPIAPQPAPQPARSPAPPPLPAPVSPSLSPPASQPDDAPVALPAPTPQTLRPDQAPQIPLAQRASEFASANRHWLLPLVLALVLVPAACWLWAWLAHRSAYDRSGLPRGPKL